MTMCRSLAGNRAARSPTGAASEEPSCVRVKEKNGTSGAGALSLDDELDDLGWDSLSIVEFIARVDVALGVTVDAQRLADCTTIRDLHDLTLPSVA